MSLATLERVILAGAKRVFNNPKLRAKDIMEWSTGNIETHEGEVVAYVQDPGAYVAILKEHDKRTKQ